MSQRMPAFFDRPGLQLLLFGGKGGVGKTTCATAAALRLSALAPQRSWLLVSTDPAHSVRDSLAGPVPAGNLEVLELDAPQHLAKFREQNGAMLREIAAAGTFLDDEDINRFLSLSLPGLDELMAFFEISSWVEARRYDCIVVDTAPTGHTLRLLAMPEMIGRWLDMLEVLLAKRRYMRRVFRRDRSPDRLDLFVAGWKSSLQRTARLLRDPARTQFVPVTIAEPLSVHETLALCHELLGRKIPVSELIVNQLHLECDCRPCSAAGSAEQIQIQQLLAGLESPCSAWGMALLPKKFAVSICYPDSGTTCGRSLNSQSVRSDMGCPISRPCCVRRFVPLRECSLSCWPARAAWARRRSRAPLPCAWPATSREAGSALLD